MEDVHNVRKPISLTFTLTRLQRIANPLERFICIYPLIIALIAFIVVLFAPGSWPDGIIITSIIMTIFIIPFIRQILSLYHSWISSEYNNVIVIDDGSISFGYNKPIVTIGCKTLIVTKGLFGTYVINVNLTTLVIPKNVIQYERLIDLIEQRFGKNLKSD